jgi:hypothetical protein
MIKYIIYIIIFAVPVSRISAVENKCDYTKFKPMHITHFAERAAINRVIPQYPPSAEAEGVSGTIEIKILINKQGFVERSCPLTDAKKADSRLLVTAEAAALQWIFSKQFGVTPEGDIKFNYVEDVLKFEFIPKKRPN